MVRLIVIALIIFVVIYLFKKGVFSNAIFKIRVTGRDLNIRGTIPGRPWSEVRAFLKSLNLPSGTTITGHPDGRGFRLHISGRVDEGTEQRIRNFLYL